MKSGVFDTTAAECVRTCVRFGGKYILLDRAKERLYQIANPEVVATYAAKQVRIRGTINANGMLTVEQIEDAKAAPDAKRKK
jgi:hypothetical protein